MEFRLFRHRTLRIARPGDHVVRGGGKRCHTGESLAVFTEVVGILEEVGCERSVREGAVGKHGEETIA